MINLDNVRAALDRHAAVLRERGVDATVRQVEGSGTVAMRVDDPRCLAEVMVWDTGETAEQVFDSACEDALLDRSNVVVTDDSFGPWLEQFVARVRDVLR